MKGTTGDGELLLVVGLDFDNLDRLRAGKPARSAVPGLPVVILHAGPTLRDVVDELVQAGVLPAVAIEQFAEPAPDAARVWDSSDPGQVRTVPVETGDAGA